MKKTAIELFAGVGGFRVGLNKVEKIDEMGHALETKNFEFLWANQWEPSTIKQHAFECYKERFQCSESECSNEDITKVDKSSIPDHTLLCGGFPCQDYSVARSLKNEKGIEGKKGVLWWQINEILQVKKTPFVLLENVDRLLRAPSKQRGQAFGIMLRCFYENGYGVEWRVINAAQYGYPQRRRRIFIFAFHKSTNYYQKISLNIPRDIIFEKGLFAQQFPVYKENCYSQINDLKKYDDLLDVSEHFSEYFGNSGCMLDGVVYSYKTKPIETNPIVLRALLESNVSSDFYLDTKKSDKFKFLRGAKKVLRTRKVDGGQYYYSEGSMSESDSLDLPGRTMLTSEGTTNRSSHIIRDPQNGELRFLTPVECERLNQFPDNWTATMNLRKRYFMMGNALVCGVVSHIGEKISEIIDLEN